jgi:hypothetical protein
MDLSNDLAGGSDDMAATTPDRTPVAHRGAWQFKLRTMFALFAFAGLTFAALAYVLRDAWERDQAARDQETDRMIGEVLCRWSLAGWHTSSPSEIPRELEDALEKDTEEILNLCGISVTESIQRQLTHLRRVHWLRVGKETAADDLQWIRQIGQLRGLSLEGMDLRGVDLSPLGDLRSLQLLDLTSARLSVEDFRTLPRLECLRAIELDGHQVTDGYVGHLARLRLPSLVRLTLDSTSVSDTGLAELCGTYNLKFLNLYQSRRITGNSVDAITKMNNLRTLGIGGTGLSPNYMRTTEVRRLEKLLPACSIDYGD